MYTSLSQKTARCRCGKVALEVTGLHIMTVACYCDDCQAAGEKLSSLPHADKDSILEADGGTRFFLHRKDKVTCVRGAELLCEHRLNPSSATRRIIAGCCNTPMFLEFEKGHWLSLYMNRFDQADQQPIEQRTMTKYKRPDVHFTDNIPSPPSHTFRFVFKLLMAWAAMKFKTPKVDYVQKKIHIPIDEQQPSPHSQ